LIQEVDCVARFDSGTEVEDDYTCDRWDHCALAEEEEIRIRAPVRMGVPRGTGVAAADTVALSSNFADTVRLVAQMAGEVDWGDYRTLLLVVGTD
jgi:hypothetical protein